MFFQKQNQILAPCTNTVIGRRIIKFSLQILNFLFVGLNLNHIHGLLGNKSVPKLSDFSNGTKNVTFSRSASINRAGSLTNEYSH